MLAAMVNGWFLLPDLVFSGTTAAATTWTGSVLWTVFDTPELLFNPLRAVPIQSPTVALYVQAPVWFLGWSTVCGIWIWTKRSLSNLRKPWTALALLLAALFVLIIETPLWQFVPPVLRIIQFPYRLNGFVLLLTAALVLVGLLGLQDEMVRPNRPIFAWVLVVSLIGATTVSMALGIWQEWVPRICLPTTGCVSSRSAGLTTVHVLPATWYAGGLYTDTTAPVVQVPTGRSFAFSPDLIDPHGDSLVATVDLPGGTQPLITNIMAGPQLVTIGGGIERVGRTATGMVVVRRVKPGDGPVRVVIQTADNLVIRAGRWMSLAGSIGVGLLLIAEVFLGWRRRRRIPRGTADVQGLDGLGII
jgi:hypothetical protein